ncbi:hypothetical protein MN116_006820, partial [Schistosoma mekongi]
MIFQQDFNTQHIFSPIPIGTHQPFSPKSTTILSREERLRLRKQERRRRKLQEIKSGIKRFIAMLFSHIGLSGLVIAYTIIGGLLFGGIERGKEKEIKTLAYEYRIEASNDFLQILFNELHHYLIKQSKTCNETIAILQFFIDFLENEKPNKNVLFIENRIDHRNYTKLINDNITEILNTTNLSNSSTYNKFNNNINDSTSIKTRYLTKLNTLTTIKHSIDAYQINKTNTLSEFDLDNIRSENSLKLQFILLLRGRIQLALMEFTKRIVDFIETDGWNGNDSMDDLKWSFAGSVLYAITVITTIGYGHATPKTNLGKFITILYALIGIPLMFLYLSNIGDYLADLFRVIYSRTCRTNCEKFCSASIFNHHHHHHHHHNQHSEQMNKLSNKILQHNNSNLHIDTDLTINPIHSHCRRRKRILLTPFNSTIINQNNLNNTINNNIYNNNTNNNNNNNVNCILEQKQNNSINLHKIDNKITIVTKTEINDKKKEKIFHVIKNKQFIINLITYYHKSCEYIRKSRLMIFIQSKNTTSLTQKAKHNLRELFHPLVNWIQQMIQTFAYET